LSGPKIGSRKRRAIFDFGPVYLAIVVVFKVSSSPQLLNLSFKKFD
jgi:hypothetical protein